METMVQDFFSFGVFLLPIFAVEVRSYVFDSGKRFFCIPCLFLGNVIFLESWFCHLFKNIVISSKFFPMHFLSCFWHFCSMVDILGVSGPGIIFLAWDLFFWVALSFVLSFFSIMIIVDIICKHLYVNTLR